MPYQVRWTKLRQPLLFITHFQIHRTYSKFTVLMWLYLMHRFCIYYCQYELSEFGRILRFIHRNFSLIPKTRTTVTGITFNPTSFIHVVSFEPVGSVPQIFITLWPVGSIFDYYCLICGSQIFEITIHDRRKRSSNLGTSSNNFILQGSASAGVTIFNVNPCKTWRGTDLIPHHT